MPIFPGYADKAFVSNNLDVMQRFDKKVVEMGIVKGYDETTFMELMKMMGRYVLSDADQWYGYADEKSNIVGVVSAATGSGTTNPVITLTAATSNYWARQHTIEFADYQGLQAEIIGHVQTAGQDILTLRAESNITVVPGDRIVWRGQSGAEGNNPKEGIKWQPNTYGNKIEKMQYFTPVMTDVYLMTAIEMRDESAFNLQYMKDVEKVKRGISLKLWAGRGSTATWRDQASTFLDADGFKIQKQSGVDEQISAYGLSSQTTTGGIITRADVSTWEDMLVARKVGKKFKLAGSTRALRPLVQYAYGLNGAISPVRLTQTGGQPINYELKRFTSEGLFQYDLMILPELDDIDLFPIGAARGIGESIYALYDGDIPLMGGGSVPALEVKYMKPGQQKGVKPPSGPDVSWMDLIEETLFGGEAPNPTAGDDRLQLKWTTFQAMNMKGTRRFAKWLINR